jgi:hypothetical protein
MELHDVRESLIASFLNQDLNIEDKLVQRDFR